MIIVWKGRGPVLLLFFFAAIGLDVWWTRQDAARAGGPSGWPFLVAGLGAIFFGVMFARQHGVRWNSADTLYWIPIEIWGGVMAIAGLVIMLGWMR
jgi:hypothetical protein